MKTSLMSLLFVLIATGINAQDLNKKHYDDRLEYEILVDYCDRSGLELDSEFKAYFSEEYKYYEPNQEVINSLGSKLNDFDITIVLGTWCGDSQYQVPCLFKVLDQLNYDEGKLTIIAVNRDKKTINADISDLNIKYVPTIIVYKKGKEVGRIIESPNESLEEDLLKIIE